MALTQTEAAILDLLDQDLSVRAIAARGFDRAMVERIKHKSGSARRHCQSDLRRRTALQARSAGLAAAIQRERAAR